jgi:hypothetical protein
MSVVTRVQERSRTGASSLNSQLFDSPQPAGRKITAGFTYLQRIGKAANYDVWFPEVLKRELGARQAQGQTIGAAQFASQWAAVRQFELLQESGNYKIYDLDPELLQRAMVDLTRSMRAGGYRVTVAMLGRYEETSTGDELEILDRRLQEGIAQMIHMLYLEETSKEANAENSARLDSCQWDYREDLPHIGMVLGASDMFCPEQNRQRRHKFARQFFDILSTLPQNHIVHDTAVGLQLPELIGENQWIYIADSDETFGALNRLLTNLFDKFDGVSLSALQGREDARDEVKASTLHMRGYGDHLNGNSAGFYRRASLALN